MVVINVQVYRNGSSDRCPFEASDVLLYTHQGPDGSKNAWNLLQIMSNAVMHE